MFVSGEQLRMKQMKMKKAETNVWHDKDLESIHKNGEFLKDLKPRVDCHDHICLLRDIRGPEWRLDQRRAREVAGNRLEEL